MHAVTAHQPTDQPVNLPMTHNLSIEHMGSHLNKPLKTNNRLIKKNFYTVTKAS